MYFDPTSYCPPSRPNGPSLLLRVDGDAVAPYWCCPHTQIAPQIIPRRPVRGPRTASARATSPFGAQSESHWTRSPAGGEGGGAHCDSARLATAFVASATRGWWITVSIAALTI